MYKRKNEIDLSEVHCEMEDYTGYADSDVQCCKALKSMTRDDYKAVIYKIIDDIMMSDTTFNKMVWFWKNPNSVRVSQTFTTYIPETSKEREDVIYSAPIRAIMAVGV